MCTISTRPFLRAILKAIRAGVGFGSGTETSPCLKLFCSGLCIIDFYAAVLHYQNLKSSALYQRSKGYTCTPAHIMASGVHVSDIQCLLVLLIRPCKVL